VAAGAHLRPGALRMSAVATQDLSRRSGGAAKADHITGPAFLLVLGRTAGLVATFAIGPLLTRLLTLEELGTYRTFFLLYATFFGLAQLGMAESLYYFVPRAPGRAGRYGANAALTLIVSGLVCAGILALESSRIAAHFNNPALPEYFGLLGLFLTLMLVTTVFEILMVSRKQHLNAAITYALSDVTRTAFFIVPALLFVSLRAVFIGAVVFAALRLVMMTVMLRREFGRIRLDLALWRTQLGYALPFALAVSIEVILVTYHQYVVGGRFDTETFAVYATACMSIPLVDLIMTSTTSVMMVKMAEDSSDRHFALALFHETVSRLAFLLMPLSIGLSVLAAPFIVTLFTTKLQAGIPIFSVWVLTVIPAIFAVDAMLRVYAQTRFLLVMNLVRLGFVMALIGWFIGAFGLVGAVLVTLIATAVAKALAIVRIARLLHVAVAEVLPWRALGRITLRAIAAAVPAWLVAEVLAAIPALAFAAGAATYAATYLVLCYAPGIAEPAAIRVPIVERLRRLPVSGVAGIVSRSFRLKAEATR
jgi:O-antigen/teichoic acid export membrane protein